MPQHAADKRIAVNATPHEVHEFLQKLSSDDGFRARFKASPGEVLAEHHLHLPVEDLPAEAILPDAAALKKALEHYRNTGELDVGAARSPDRWPYALFWWLYYTPNARPMPPGPACARADALKVSPHATPEQSAASLAKMAQTRVGVNATPRELFDFVLRLASDDTFRAKLEQDPSRALAEYHISVPGHAHVIIPHKADLQRALLDMMSGHERVMVMLPYDGDHASDLSWLASFLCFVGGRGKR